MARYRSHETVDVLKTPVMERYTVAAVAKVMARQTNASWSSRVHLSHKAATRTKACPIQRGMAVALKRTILTVVRTQVSKAEEPVAGMKTALMVLMVSMTVMVSIIIAVWQGLTIVLIATVMTEVSVQMQLEAPRVEAVTAAGVPAASGTV